MTVDDSASMRRMITFTLKSANHEVIEAVDGRDALSKLNGSPIHLVITDINMPNMNGIELVYALRSLPQFKFVPIVMLTTEMQVSKKLECKKAGATGFISKPFRPEQLLMAARKLLRDFPNNNLPEM